MVGAISAGRAAGGDLDNAYDIGALSRTIAGDVSLCMPASMHWVVTASVASVVAAKFPDIRLRLMDGASTTCHARN